MPPRATVAGAAKALAKADPVLAGIIRKVGPITLAPRREPFPALARSIFYQQLAGPAAAAIMRRFVALYPGRDFPLPQDVLDTSDEALRSAGLSRQKTGYLKDLSARFADGRLSPQALLRMPDDDLEKALVSVKGVGRWTADMFLINTLHRLDVLPVDDLGLRRAVQQAYGLDRIPLPKEVSALGERWRPYRTVASLYLWRSLGVRLPEPATPQRRA